MTERAQVLFLQILGSIVVFGVVLLSAMLSTKYPIPATLVSALVTGLCAKLFATPIAAVTVDHAGRLPPQVAAAVAQRAIASLPPAQRVQLEAAEVVLTNFSHPPPPPRSDPCP